MRNFELALVTLSLAALGQSGPHYGKKGLRGHHEPQPKVEMTTVTECFDIPYSIEKTCYKDSIVQYPEPCQSSYTDEVCITVDREVPAMCFNTVEEKVDYDCPVAEQKKMCSLRPKSVSRKCQLPFKKQVAGSCLKEGKVPRCEVIATPVPDTCYDTETYSERYDCWTTESSTECEADMTTGTTMCEREIEVQVPFTEDGMAIEQKCEMVTKVKNGLCKRKESFEEAYPCPETVYDNVCEPTTKVIQEPCQKPVSGIETYDCSEAKTQSIAKTCTKMIPRKRTIEECDQPQKKGLSQGLQRRNLAPSAKKGKNHCRQVEIVSEERVEYPCNEDILITVPKVCSREIVKQADGYCNRTIPDTVCHMKPRTIQKDCFKPALREIDVPCEETETVQECTDVPRMVTKTGFKVVTKTEQYECPRHDFQETCYEVIKPKKDVCQAKLLRSVPKECTREEFKEVCVDLPQQFFQPCLEQADDFVEYDCFTQETEEKCITVPTYVMGTCSTYISKEERSPCMRTEPTVECHMNDVPREGVCFHTREEKVPYTCYDQSSNRECIDLLVTGDKIAPTHKKAAPVKK